ncbi:MAG3450 family membrane protein [Mycoplasmopsis adleri]|uniref:MAG3450 family membrane protein n=1 Tax=Mycoplasmopsis adleri TaxID=51362 RepID=UPI0038732DF7
MNNKDNKQKNTNKKNKLVSLSPLLIVLFISIFIVIPMTAVWIISAPEFGNQKLTSSLWICLIPCFIGLFAIFMNWLFYFFKILNLRSFNFSVPIIFAFWILIMFILIPMAFWIKYIIAPIVGIVVALICNIVTGKIEDRQEEALIKNNTNNTNINL